MTSGNLCPRRLAAAGAVAACLAGVVPATATPGALSATGRICGASRCLTLPRPLAIELSQRNDTYASIATPRRTAFYRITIKAVGRGFISKSIVWAPAARAWYVLEHTKWPDVGYWRTEGTATHAALTGIARKLKPFPKPRRWVLPR